MKRAKDKYMINRTKYKDIKRYDHKQMEDFLTDVYKNGYVDGKSKKRREMRCRKSMKNWRTIDQY